MSNKTITIDPNLFKITPKKNTTRKRQQKTDNNEIRFKPLKNKTVKYNKLLQYIRAKQNANYEQLINSKKNEENKNISSYSSSDPPKSEFEESLHFLKELRDNNNNKQSSINKKSEDLNDNTLPIRLPLHNVTVKQHYPIQEHVNIHFPSNENIESFNNNQIFEINKNIPPFKIEPQPKYGVLKGGLLPTYREYMKNPHHHHHHHHNNHNNHHNHNIHHTHHNIHHPHNHNTFTEGNYINNTGDNTHSNNEYLIKSAKLLTLAKNDTIDKEVNKNIKLHYPKQKKTIRRTFRVGRSKHYSNIGILINNKTIRNDCYTQKYKLKQMPINEVKKYLMKKGLIKVGTTAPNDILRKMYESANLICGEVQNYNTDILLHNYINDSSTNNKK